MSSSGNVPAARYARRERLRILRPVRQVAERIEASARRCNSAMVVFDAGRLLDLLEIASERHTSAARAFSEVDESASQGASCVTADQLAAGSFTARRIAR